MLYGTQPIGFSCFLGRLGRLLSLGAVALLLSPPVLLGQQQATSEVSGRVVEAPSGEAIEAVTVLLVDLDRRTVTGEDGGFRFESVPVGAHRLRVSHLGFASEERTIEVQEDFGLAVTIRLEPEPVELEPLVAEVEAELRVDVLEEEGFYRRRKRGRGEFLGPQYLTRWSGTRLPAMLRRLQNVSISRTGPVGRSFSGSSVCVDGREWPWGVPDLPTSVIAAIEAGTLMGCRCHVCVWTWPGPNRFKHVDLSETGCPLPAVRNEAC